jgi:hypothetical protein
MGQSGPAAGAIGVLRPGRERPLPQIIDHSSETWFLNSPPVRSGERAPHSGCEGEASNAVALARSKQGLLQFKMVHWKSPYSIQWSIPGACG